MLWLEIPAYAGSTLVNANSINWNTDHPRIRGEHRRCGRPGRPRGGSSPHTRGAPHEGGPFALDDGIIPAYAGSTSRFRSRRAKPADHPRIRGEHVGDGAVHLHLEGIIPAYAGSTTTSSPSECMSSDHPRIRGEHDHELAERVHELGSSPHTRGARHADPRRDPGVRIIPAYAGSTRLPISPTVLAADHPRIRGEHLFRWI